MNLGIIPSRGGSKGLPGKNLRLLAGRSLLAWTIDAAMASGVLDRVLVSTDDEGIADAARAAGAEVLVRPANLAQDDSTTLDVVRHVLETIGADDDATVVVMQPTSPLRSAQDIRDGVAALASADIVIGVCEAHPHPAWCFLEKDGLLAPLMATSATRRQDLTSALGLNGALYVFTAGHARSGDLLRGRIRGHVMTKERSVDIDDELDMAVAAANLNVKSQRQDFSIQDRPVGPSHPVFVIAEAGVNHNGDPALALELVDAAADAGADAVKFQTFRARSMATAAAGRAEYQRDRLGEGSQVEMLEPLELDETTHRKLQARAAERGIVFLSTPFDSESAELLARIDIPVTKIGSGDLTNHPLLSQVASRGMPMIVSTGMATLEEVFDAHRILADTPHLFLHCTTSYPAQPADLGLRAIPLIALATGVPCGYSDHSSGKDTAIAAVALGACVLEKHITLDSSMDGPDHAASLEPDAFTDYVQAVRTTELSLGRMEKVPSRRELEIGLVARKSLATARALEAGAVLMPGDLVCKRPGTGVSPSQLGAITGRRLARALPGDALLKMDDLV